MAWRHAENEKERVSNSELGFAFDRRTSCSFRLRCCALCVACKSQSLCLSATLTPINLHERAPWYCNEPRLCPALPCSWRGSISLAEFGPVPSSEMIRALHLCCSTIHPSLRPSLSVKVLDEGIHCHVRRYTSRCRQSTFPPMHSYFHDLVKKSLCSTLSSILKNAKCLTTFGSPTMVSRSLDQLQP